MLTDISLLIVPLVFDHHGAGMEAAGLIGKTDCSKKPTPWLAACECSALFLQLWEVSMYTWTNSSATSEKETTSQFTRPARNRQRVCKGVSIFLSTERRNPKETRFAVSTECVCQAASFLRDLSAVALLLWVCTDRPPTPPPPPQPPPPPKSVLCRSQCSFRKRDMFLRGILKAGSRWQYVIPAPQTQ